MDESNVADAYLDELKAILDQDRKKRPTHGTYYVSETQYARWKELGYI